MVPRTRILLLAASLALTAVVAGCLAPPENLACTADSEGNHLSWDPVDNATSYNVYRGDEGSDFLNATMIGNTTDTSFTDTDVIVGETYRYWITAVGEAELTEEELDALEELEGEEVSSVQQTENETTEVESLPSEPCDVTAVPLFPSAIAGAVALAGAVGVYVVLRRRG